MHGDAANRRGRHRRCRIARCPGGRDYKCMAGLLESRCSWVSTTLRAHLYGSSTPPGGLQSVIMSTRLAKRASMFGNFGIGVAIQAAPGGRPELSRGLAGSIREPGRRVTFGAVVL